MYTKLSLNWADFDDVLKALESTDSIYKRKNPMFSQPDLTSEMRSILLDWMNEVCTAYKLQRETYYTAVEYVDRVLSLKPVQRSSFQCLGTAALFMAAKHLEVTPPKIEKFVYVTDHSCTNKEILSCELQMAMILRWHLKPVTPVDYLNLFLQVAAQYRGCQRPAIGDNRTAFSIGSANVINYSGLEFARVMQIIDLCALSDSYHMFPFKIIAAAALSHVASPELVTLVSGIPSSDLEDCAQWMAPLVCAVRSSGFVSAVPPGLGFLIQTHSTNLQLLAQAKQFSANLNSVPATPDNRRRADKALPTPPLSASTNSFSSD